MPQPARKAYSQYQYYEYAHRRTASPERPYVHIAPSDVPNIRRANTKKVKRNTIIHRIISLAFAGLIAFTVLPANMRKVVKPMFTKSPYPAISTDYNALRFPTSSYLANHWFMGQRSLEGAYTKKAQMLIPEETIEMVDLENSLKNLMAQYPSIQPSVYVWEYETQKFADIKADELYSAASIIKLPVLVQLFRSIEKNQLTIYDEMILNDVLRAEGSGSLQFKAENSKWTIDQLARLMITESDNSATNMLMSKIGSMTDVNQGIREWGLKHTYVNAWLPDLEGTNYTTARDIATILYNIDNPNFLSVTSREKIFDYMGHVHNDRLIPAGLGAGATFLHKTGDIGKMLGDAGIVYSPNGTKYIVVILANRPHNSILGKEFIVKASEIIYNTMVR